MTVRDRRGRRRPSVGTALAALAAPLCVAVGCARSVPPPGGPIDTTPPFALATTPADSSVGVDRVTGVEILFSEAMERASVRDNLRLYPPAGLPNYSWSGRRFRVSWGESLRAGTTYQLFLSGRARDVRNVELGAPLVILFSTGDSIARGRIAGVVRAKTLPIRGVPVLLFADSTGGMPDTTQALEPSYKAETDSAGAYAFSGLPIGEGFTVHAFYDRNGDEYFDSDSDVLAGHDAAVRLTPDRTLADSINIVAVNPRAPAILNGSIASPDSSARFRIEVRAAPDSSVASRVERTGPGTFSVRLPAGSYWLAARRLASAARAARAGQPRSPAFEEAVASHAPLITVAAEEEVAPIILTFSPAAAAPPPPQEESR